jgi:hypothetical protein
MANMSRQFLMGLGPRYLEIFQNNGKTNEI